MLYNRPYTERILEVAGPTWFEVLLAAGLVPEGAVQEARGVRLLAADGCVCLSLGEKVVDDILSSEGDRACARSQLPGSNLRSDWKCGDAYVEFFGLTGDVVYDANTQAKRKLASRLGLRLIELFPADLADPTALRNRLVRDLADARRVPPVTVQYVPPAFEYVAHTERVAERRSRTHGEQLQALLAAGGGRNDSLGVVEFREYDSSGWPVLHRIGAPARYWDNGTVEWYRHGVRHRDYGAHRP